MGGGHCESGEGPERQMGAKNASVKAHPQQPPSLPPQMCLCGEDRKGVTHVEGVGLLCPVCVKRKRSGHTFGPDRNKPPPRAARPAHPPSCTHCGVTESSRFTSLGGVTTCESCRMKGFRAADAAASEAAAAVDRRQQREQEERTGQSWSCPVVGRRGPGIPCGLTNPNMRRPMLLNGAWTRVCGHCYWFRRGARAAPDDDANDRTFAADIAARSLEAAAGGDEAAVDALLARARGAPGIDRVRTPARDYSDRMAANVERMEGLKGPASEIAGAIRAAVDVNNKVAVAKELTKQLGGWPSLVHSTDEELDMLSAVLTELSKPEGGG